MSVLESKKGGKGTVSGQPAEEVAISDIENVLNFLDSEEYQEVHQPTPPTKNELKGDSVGKAHHNAPKPLASEIDSVKFPKQEVPTIKTTRCGKAPRPPQIEKMSTKNASGPLDRPKGKKIGKIWFLCLGTATLIFLAILALYEMGYLFAGA